MMRRLLFGLAAGRALGVIAVLGAGFVWPDGAGQDELNLGSAEAFPVGEPRWVEGIFEFTDFRWDVSPVIDSPGRSHEVTLWVIKHADGGFSAFSARDPRNGCPLAWRTDLDQFGPGGFFRDRCHGSTYNERGGRVFGPSPRGMDYLDVDINERGEVIVHLRTLHRGEPARQQADADSTPTPAMTPAPSATEIGGAPREVP